jgi:cytochrome b561
MLVNSNTHYGLVSIVLHWLMALCFIGMYALGLWMVELDYYDSWYHRAPDLHRSLGILLVGLMLLRFIWNRLQPRPEDLSSDALLNRVAHLAHTLFYLLVLLMLVSGYLISTAKGKGIEVFDWFALPALLSASDQRGDWAGDIHEILAHLFILLAVAHAVAALKHHFKDRNQTLVRMLRVKPNHPRGNP